MRKFLFISSVLLSTLIADNSLGKPLSSSSEIITQTVPIEKQTIEQQTPTQSYTKSYTKTVVQPSQTVTNTHTFKEDHHRYDKQYSDFDYDSNSYYNDDGYYYGYYDQTGYFFNNIFFIYSDLYTYNDRRYRRGCFIPRHHHHRTYRHHRVNNWNSRHAYRQPNHIVYGDYYDRSYYPHNHSNYNSSYSRSNTRMHTPTQYYNHNQVNNRNHNQSIRNSNINQYNNRSYNNRNSNNSRDYNSRSYNNNQTTRRNSNINYNQRSGARMIAPRSSSSTRPTNIDSISRSSAPKQERSSTGHMQMSR